MAIGMLSSTLITLACCLLLLYVVMKVNSIDFRVEKIHKSLRSSSNTVPDEEMVRLLSEAMEDEVVETPVKSTARRRKKKVEVHSLDNSCEFPAESNMIEEVETKPNSNQVLENDDTDNETDEEIPP